MQNGEVGTGDRGLLKKEGDQRSFYYHGAFLVEQLEARAGPCKCLGETCEDRVNSK